MKWIRRAGISTIIVLFAIACATVLLFHWHTLGWQALSVPTGSMRPSMPPGSLVLVHRVPDSRIKVGDVITYINPQNSKTTITHRVIKTELINGKIPAFKTKGDANPSADPWVIVGGIVQGKAVWHVPHVGNWLVWSKRPAGLLALIYIPALLLMAEEIQRMAAYLKAKQAYRLFGYRNHWVFKKSLGLRQKCTASAILAFILVAGSVAVAFPARALLKSNSVSLISNQLSVPATTSGTVGCSTTNNVNVSGTNQQTAASGNATGGAATSGSVSNSNSTTVTVSTKGC